MCLNMVSCEEKSHVSRNLENGKMIVMKSEPRLYSFGLFQVLCIHGLISISLREVEYRLSGHIVLLGMES